MVVDVTVVATARSTSERLCRYLEEAGLCCGAVADLARATTAAHAARAYVVLPDDFDAQAVDAAVRVWAERRPRPRIVIVRGSANHAGSAALERSSAVTILPRPAFSWAILDAIVGREVDDPNRRGPPAPAGSRRAPRPAGRKRGT